MLMLEQGSLGGNFFGGAVCGREVDFLLEESVFTGFWSLVFSTIKLHLGNGIQDVMYLSGGAVSINFYTRSDYSVAIIKNTTFHQNYLLALDDDNEYAYGGALYLEKKGSTIYV